MKAVVHTRYGSPEHLELREVPDPVPGEGEVLVGVRATSVHPDVWHVVMGRPVALRVMGNGLLRPKRPAIPGTDMAGVVEGVGPGAARFRPGDAVFGETSLEHPWAHGGAWAERVAVPERLLAPLPDGVSFVEAGSVPSTAVIALQNLRHTERMGPGRRVLINGAGGGVGSFALQYVKARGARVTAVDAPGKLGRLRELGADEVVDYTREDFTRRGATYDLVFDVPGRRPLSEIRRALAPDGRYVPIGHEGFGAAGRPLLGLVPRFLWMMAVARWTPEIQGPGTPLPGKEEAVARTAGLLASGVLIPLVDRAYPLEEFREAFGRMTGGEALGRVMLTL